MMQFQTNLKFVIYAHGSILTSSIPIKMAYINQYIHLTTTLTKNSYTAPIQLSKLTIGDIINHIKIVDHNGFQPPLIHRCPQQLTEYQVLNRSKNSNLFNQKLNFNSLVVESFQKKQTHREDILVELYLQWQIEKLLFNFMDIFRMTYTVIDSAMTLKQIIRNFSSTLAKTLKMSNNIQFNAHYEQKQINQNMKYSDFKVLTTSTS